jgi:hypothetical protein
MIIKAKALEFGKFHLKMHLNIFVSISFQTCFDLENHELKKIAFNKSYSFLCYLGHECIIYK